MQRPRRIEPAPGQESVWDYPRPPRLERSERRIRVRFNGIDIVDTHEAWRVLETSHPPVYYLPRRAFVGAELVDSLRSSFCEWKGAARYLSIQLGDRIARDVGWSYPQPAASFEPIRDHVALYPAAMDRCSVDELEVRPQPGRFYGGWVTADVVGPFKGEPGTEFW